MTSIATYLTGLCMALIQPTNGLARGADPAIAAQWSHVYDLADAQGTLRLDWPPIAYDATAQEVYAVNTGDNVVHVLDNHGMETFTFGDSGALGGLISVAPLLSGDLLVLARNDTRSFLWRCDFRGEPVADVSPSEMVAGYAPDSVVAVADKIYLPSAGRQRVLMLDATFKTTRTVDLAALAGLTDENRADNGILSISVDPRGNLLFTIPTLFTAYVVSPDGQVRSFGRPGSVPGRFNIAAAIAADAEGNIFVADALRCVVMVFDSALKFRGEFGGRGKGPGRLMVPRGLVVGGGKIWVAQGAKRGVRVFNVSVPAEPAT